MFDLFKLFFGSLEATDTRPPASVDMHDALTGLDIASAKTAHLNWKQRLESYLAGQSTETFRAEEICFDDRCELGRWIHGRGKARLGRFPGFTALTGDHKMFHYSASNVVALYKAGHLEDARQMLNQQFADFSAKVLRDLENLEKVTAAIDARRS